MPVYVTEAVDTPCLFGRVLTLHKTAEGRYVIYSLLPQK